VPWLSLARTDLYVNSLKIWGRKITFTSWPIKSLGCLLLPTVQDTNQGLLSIHNQLNQLKIGTSPIQQDRVIRHDNYICNFLRQIDVSQKLSEETNTSKVINTELTELLNEDLNDKKLVFDFNPQQMSRIEVLADT
jgi:hypothetical protein